MRKSSKHFFRAVSTLLLATGCNPAPAAEKTSSATPFVGGPGVVIEFEPPAVYAGETVDAYVTIFPYDNPFSISRIAISGLSASRYKIVRDDCVNTTVQSATYCQVEIEITADEALYLFASLNVTTSEGEFSHDIGVHTPYRDLILSPAAIEFGAQPVFAPATRSMVLTNPNPLPVNLPQSPVRQGDFTAQVDQCAQIAANSACAYPVAFTPTILGADTANWRVNVSCNEPSTPCSAIVVGATGTGTMPDAVNVDLKPYLNETGISSGSGVPITDGGLDGAGNTYGTFGTAGIREFAWCHEIFSFATPDTPTAAENTTIALHAGHYYGVSILGLAVNGAQRGLPFRVTYDDGTVTTVTRDLSDWKTPQHFVNENIAAKESDRITADGLHRQPGPYYLYGYTLPIDSAKVVKSIKLPPTRNVAVLAMNLNTAPIPLTVNLRPYYNLTAIGHDRSATTHGGIDGQGNALSYEQLADSPVSADLQYNIPDTSEWNGVVRSTITLPSGHFSSLRLLGMGVNGNQLQRTFLIHYTDGSSTPVTQSLSDWHTPSFNAPTPYSGESAAIGMSYRLNVDGEAHPGAYFVYQYTLPLDETKTVQSIQLPNTANVVVLSMSLEP